MAAKQRPNYPSDDYHKRYSFGFTCLVYHATARFCRRASDDKKNPLGKTAEQMVDAARSARQNIVEGTAQSLDAAKRNLDELAGDYEAFLIDRDEPAWSELDKRWRAVRALQLAPFNADADMAHAFSVHLITMRNRFAPWLEHKDVLVVANAILAVIRRAQQLLTEKEEATASAPLEADGARKRMARPQQEQQEESAAQSADVPPPPPACPECGKSMHLRKAKNGPNAGKSFWGCTGFPGCKGLREVKDETSQRAQDR